MVAHAGVFLGRGLVLFRLGAPAGCVGRVCDHRVEGPRRKAGQHLQRVALDDFPLGVIAHRQGFSFFFFVLLLLEPTQLLLVCQDRDAQPLGVADLRPHSLRPDGTVDIDLLAGLHQPQAHFPVPLGPVPDFPGQQWEETSNGGR